MPINKITKVVNIYKNKYDVYIGRTGKGQDGYFGNPFPLEDFLGNRLECILAFKRYFDKRLDDDLEFRERVLELDGKTLGCFCKPKHCHGDIIADYLNSL